MNQIIYKKTRFWSTSNGNFVSLVSCIHFWAPNILPKLTHIISALSEWNISKFFWSSFTWSRHGNHAKCLSKTSTIYFFCIVLKISLKQLFLLCWWFNSIKYSSFFLTSTGITSINYWWESTDDWSILDFSSISFKNTFQSAKNFSRFLCKNFII